MTKGSIKYSEEGLQKERVYFQGNLDNKTTPLLWKELTLRFMAEKKDVIFDLKNILYIDGTGIVLVFSMLTQIEKQGKKASIENIPEKFQAIFELYSLDTFKKEPIKKQLESVAFVPYVGDKVYSLYTAFVEHITFFGEIISTGFYLALHPKKMRWKNVLKSSYDIGVSGTPIVVLIGFLMGLIMSFQSAISLERFGATVYLADMLGLVVFRELGPLITSILLAGRSGSAFAAEIGTMKVSEEVSALQTLGISAVAFLAIPKILAAMLMIPFLTIFFDIASLVGGFIVMVSLGYGLEIYLQHLADAVTFTDFFGGIFKSFVFAFLVSSIGCLRGLQTGLSADSVGISTTSAVVSGITLIAAADGIFAVIYFYLGI